MKGGITSGVIYPGAVAKIAEAFQLKGIGGTSAGAIAAAAAAAAEYGKLNGRENSFQDFAQLAVFLGKRNRSGSSNLFTFFQPQSKTKRIFNTLAGSLEANTLWSGIIGPLGNAGISFPFSALVGIVPGGLLVILALTHRAGLLTLWSLIIGVLFFVAGGILALVVRFICVAGKAIPANYFGLCSGMSTNAQENAAEGRYADRQALTVWLTKFLNHLAGLPPDGPPLTFGQLWWHDCNAGSHQPTRDPSIQLEMYTTCLTKGRPFRLPFQNDNNVRENVWYFKNCEFEQLFPPTVIKWMKSNPRSHGVHADLNLEEFTPLPDPWNLPVVVATRMSLSFPILLSAIPLHAYHYDVAAPIEAHSPADETSVANHKRESEVLSRFWFSDGGICSNFPIHFFDAPLPRRPTFAINLVEAPKDATSEQLLKPWMPRDNNEGIREPFVQWDENGGIKSLFGFISTIITTMQNWSDNSLSRMPGFRDRIAHVGLTKEEGGLNLQMPDSRIRTLNERGVNAGLEFVERFASDAKSKMNWPNHRWIRLRTMLSSVVEMMQAIDRACASPDSGDKGYEEWIQSTLQGAAPSYQWKSDDQRLMGLETVKDFRQVAREWRAAKLDASAGAPRPRPELRPRPRT
jgi:predicted acylesterase/phospholipase RssA